MKNSRLRTTARYWRIRLVWRLMHHYGPIYHRRFPLGMRKRLEKNKRNRR